MKERTKIILLVLIMVVLNIANVDASQYTGLRSYLIGDYESGRVLEGEDIYDVVEIASISKVMSYMVVMDSGVDLKEKVAIDQDSLNVGGSLMKIKLNKEYTVDELLNYSLITSSNNAIYALSKHISGSEELFVEKMNKKAKELGLDTAKFYNCTGLPIKELGIQNVMSANDIFKMSRYAIENYDILERTSQETIWGLDFWGKEKELNNTNPTITLDGVDGLKTGHTNKAGYCLVNTFKIDDENGRVIGVFMGARSEQKRKEITTKAVMDVRKNYDYTKLLTKDESLGNIDIPDSNRKNLEVFSFDDYYGIVDLDKSIEYNIKLDDRLILPIKKGQVFAKVEVLNGDITIYEGDVIAKKTIRKANIFNRFFNGIGDFFRKLSNF